MLQSVAARVLYGVGQIRSFARLMLLEAGLNLVLSVALFPLLGINGVALGTLIPDVAMCIFIVLRVCLMLNVNDRDFVRHSLLQPVLTTGVLWLIWWRLAEVLPPTTRLGFAELIGAGVAIYAVLVVTLEYGHLRLTRARRALPISS